METQGETKMEPLVVQDMDVFINFSHTVSVYMNRDSEISSVNIVNQTCIPTNSSIHH